MADSVVLHGVSDDLLRVAIAAHLSRYKGLSRVHTDSDLRVFLRWCAEHHLAPLTVQRADVELFVRWLEEIRRFKPSTASRRLSVVTGFYRTCVIEAVLDASPAAYVRRPPVPAESPTLGLSHLQFLAMIVAARTSANPFDFALVAMLGLLRLRVFEACDSSIDDLGEEHGHRVLRVLGKGTKLALVPLAPAVGRAIDRAVGDRVRGPILLNRNHVRMDRHAATRVSCSGRISRSHLCTVSRSLSSACSCSRWSRPPVRRSATSFGPLRKRPSRSRNQPTSLPTPAYRASIIARYTDGRGRQSWHRPVRPRVAGRAVMPN